MASMGPVQRQSFEDRIARIGQGGANTMGEVHIGPRDEDTARDGKTSNTVRLKSKKKKNVRLGEGSNMIMVPVALLIGALSMFAGQAAAFHFFAEGGLLPLQIPVPALEPYIPYAHFAIGGLLALMFTWTFKFSGTLRKAAVLAGFIGLLYGEVQVMQKFPGIYANFFSKEYVSATLAAA